jgi:hypothetical protein
MKDLLDKLSSYNVFNYLLPGVLFAVFLDALTSFHLVQKDPVVGAFVYYFLGSVVSRIGSLLIEPLLRYFQFIEFAPYEDFVRATRVDPKIEILSEVNNMYRTICALMVCVGAVYLFELVVNCYQSLKTSIPWILCLGLFSLFLFSYQKQTIYINKRIEVNKQ